MAVGGSENHYLGVHRASRGSEEWEVDGKGFMTLCTAPSSTRLCSSRRPDQLPCCLVLHHVLFWGFLWAPRLANDFRAWGGLGQIQIHRGEGRSLSKRGQQYENRLRGLGGREQAVVEGVQGIGEAGRTVQWCC